MWKFKPFSHRESASLEGRSIDVGNLKVHVRVPIAEGGFSCVYLAHDAVHSSRKYAMKHIISNDGESLELVMKEISVMKLLNGHPNITKLLSCSIMDMGRTKEALLVMEFCEMNLVTFLENGADFFEEKNILLIFRDVCNAVLAMHNQSPPIAHRDLKAENVLLGADGQWKLCDFGSTSCNHKCFTKPEEMGIEEDNIRRHTTPSYRAPEMWDLYRREVINEKVDIWALGCLLYRMCYLKSAFDGESKLQIINVNYQIPELPKYTAALLGLIKDMIQASPDTRPDINQICFRVNGLLPVGLQKHLPDSSSANGIHKGVNSTPQRSLPPAANGQKTIQINKETHQIKSSLSTEKVSVGNAQIGTFWSTQHAQRSQGFQGSLVIKDKCHPNERHHEIIFPKADMKPTSQKINRLNTESKPASQNKSLSAHDTSLQSTGNSNMIHAENNLVREDKISELNNLKDQLNAANLEKAEIASKYEKLTVICQNQRREIHELKQALTAATASPPLTRDSSINQIFPASLQSTTSQNEKFDPNILELEQAMLASAHPGTTPAAPNHEFMQWQAFD